MESIVENGISVEGMRRVRVIGDAVIDPLAWACALPDEAVRLAEIVQGEDRALGLHSLVMTWPVRELVKGVQLADGLKVDRPMVAWKLVEGDRVSVAIRLGAEVFEREVGRRPGFAWMRSVPELAPQYLDEVELLQADWAYRGCVFIGG